MAEKNPVDPTSFVEDFDRMMAVANAGSTAWYNDPASWNAARAPYEIWEERGRPGVDGAMLYKAWPLTRPDESRLEQQSPDYRGRPTIRRGEPLEYPGHVTRVTPLQTVATFGRRAPDAPTLVVVSDGLVRHLNGDPVSPKDVANLQRTVGQLVGRSLLLGPDSGAYSLTDGESGPFPQSLGSIEQGRNRTLVGGHVSGYLQTVLRRDAYEGDKLGIVHRVLRTTDPSFAAQAIVNMEHEGFISPDFWWQNGIRGGMVFDAQVGPLVLRRLDENLAQHGEAMLAEVPADKLQPILRQYISDLLISYSRDDNRDRSMLESIISMVATDRSKKMGAGIEDSNVDMRVLIALSNGLATGINSNLEANGSDLRLPQLDPDYLWNVPAAVLRVLYATVNPNADPETMADMFEQDSIHVSVLEAIRQRLRYKPAAPSAADTRLRYPAASPGELPQLVQGMQRSDAYQELRPWRRRRQTTRPVRGYGLFLSGGALS